MGASNSLSYSFERHASILVELVNAAHTTIQQGHMQNYTEKMDQIISRILIMESLDDDSDFSDFSESSF